MSQRTSSVQFLKSAKEFINLRKLTLIWALNNFRSLRFEFWIFIYSIRLNFPAIFLKNIQECFQNVWMFFVDVCHVQHLKTQWSFLMWCIPKIHERERSILWSSQKFKLGWYRLINFSRIAELYCRNRKLEINFPKRMWMQYGGSNFALAKQSGAKKGAAFKRQRLQCVNGLFREEDTIPETC